MHNFWARKHNVVDISMFIFFLLMIWVPSGGNIYKVFALVPILSVACATMAKKGCIITVTMSVKLAIIIILSNILFCVYGMLVGAPGAIRVITIDCIWPLIYLVIIQVFPKKKNLYPMIYYFVLSADIFAIYDLVYTISNILGKYDFVKPVYQLIDTGIHYGYDITTDFFSFNSDHGMFYVFFTPVAIALVYLKCFIKDRNASFFSTKFSICSAVLLIATNILSGKRVIQLSVFITIFFILIYNIVTRVRITRKLLLCFGVFVVAFVIIGIVNLDTVSAFVSYNLESIINGFRWGSTDVNTSEYARGQQATVLLNGWLESPIFGHGAGSYAKNYYRLEESIWSYELSYHALLFQKGLAGGLIFFSAVIYTLLRWYRLSKKENTRLIALPLLMGYVCFLIGNAFNPYFGRSSMLWIFYLMLFLCDSPIIDDTSTVYE